MGQRTCDECGNPLTSKEVRRYNGWEFHADCKVRVQERVRLDYAEARYRSLLARQNRSV